MSKAFTKEIDDPGDDLIEDLGPPLPPGVKNYITAAGARRMSDELERLKGERAERKAGPATPASAEPSGEDPPNRQDAPKSGPSLREVERRIRYLARRIQTFEVVPQAPATGRVTFGSSVILHDPHQRVRRYHIVGVDEVDARRGEVSWISPIAQSLLKAQVGDIVTLRTPLCTEELEIISIEAG